MAAIDTIDPASGGSPDALSELVETTSIAIESFRIQSRSLVNLGTHEWMAISQLQAYGPMPINHLASRLALSRAALTSLVDRLVEKSWVERRDDEIDRRIVVVHLAKGAAARFALISQSLARDLHAIGESMSEADFSAVAQFVLRLTKLCESHATRLREA